MKERYIITIDGIKECGMVYYNLIDALAAFCVNVLMNNYNYITLYWSDGEITYKYGKDTLDGFITKILDKVEWPT